jgi:uncharacterized SAM-binding protein YcdF (DUF218 family)
MNARLAITTLAAMLVGCADAQDLFRPYSARTAEEIRALLARPMPGAPTDTALVLGCPSAPDGTVSDCQRCRVKTAVRLYRSGKVRTLLFTGGAAHTEAVEADSMGELALARGVPKDAVLREGRSLTTWQNFRYSLAIMRAHGLRTMVLVSVNDHLPRARRIANYYGVDDATMGFVACDLDGEEQPNEWAISPEPISMLK